MITLLFQRLDEEEALVRAELEALRKEVDAGEERLARLAITRETALRLRDEAGSRSRPGAAAELSSGESRRVPARELSRAESQDAAPRSRFPPRTAAAEPYPGRTSARVPRRVEWALGVERILAVLGASGRVMRVREIAAAIGEDTALPARVETTRSRLKRLAREGKVIETQPGAFGIAPTPTTGAKVPEPVEHRRSDPAEDGDAGAERAFVPIRLLPLPPAR